jgi:hypothetical protein
MPRYQQKPQVEIAPLDQGLIVLEPESRKFCALNPTSSVVWSRLQEPATAEQLAHHITEHFQGVTESQALQDVNAILKEMVTLGIVVTVV